MAIKRKRHFWRARCKIEVNNIAFAVSTGKKKQVGTKEYYEVARGKWREDDNILFDPAFRLKGWVKEQLAVAATESAADAARHGLFVKNIVKGKPTEGYQKIGTVKEFSGLNEKSYPGDPEELMFDGKPFKKGKTKFPLPYHDYVRGKNGTVNQWWYELNKPLTFEVEITSFARRLFPETIKTLLETIGEQKGFGDRHSNGRNGLFRLKDWKVIEEKELELP